MTHNLPLKICLIVPGFSSDAADWCIPVLVDVVRELSRRANVHVFALRYPGTRFRYAVHGAQVHAIGGGEARDLRRINLLVAACASVIAEHRRGRFSVLHGLWADEPGFLATTLGRLLRVPPVVSVMGGELVAMPDIGYGGSLATPNRLLSSVALRGAAYVTAGSSQPAELVRGILRTSPACRTSRPKACTDLAALAAGAGGSLSDGRDVVRLPWGVDASLFQPDGPARELAGEHRVLHVGSLVQIKDHETLLKAFARLSEAKPGVHLHLVGEGPLRAGLTRDARRLGVTPSVTFHGHVDRRELASYYRAAHVVAVSSRYEAQLVVALEAALCGTPIVGTAVGLVADFAPAAAISVPVGDDARLAEALIEALRPEIGRRLAAEVRTLVASGYLAEQTVEKLISVYREALVPFDAARARAKGDSPVTQPRSGRATGTPE